MSARLPARHPRVADPGRRFDVVAFSVSFEWDYTNVVTMLRLAGLPLYAAERSERHPLVVIGGAVTFVNPEPLALFADVITAGEGESLVPDLVDAPPGGGPRRDMLARSPADRLLHALVLHVAVRRHRSPGGHRAVVGTNPPRSCGRPRSRPPSASIRPTPGSSRPTPSSARASSSKSCAAAPTCAASAGPATTICRSGRSRRPHPRARPGRQPTRAAGLVSIALCDHPEIERILNGLSGMGYRSARPRCASTISPRPSSRLRESGERTLTIAPETGSDRLRRVINKTVTNEEILERADLIFASGIENLKLYYMIGLPTETDEDLESIRTLTLAMRDRCSARPPRGRLGRIIGSVNPLIRSPAPPTSGCRWKRSRRPIARSSGCAA